MSIFYKEIYTLFGITTDELIANEINVYVFLVVLYLSS